jgi:hypothetical protein
MTDENEKIDNIVTNTMQSLGEAMARLYDKALLGQLKVGDKMFTSRCVKCQISMMLHNRKIDHPYFNDNLEYLEWENEQRHSK